MGKYLITGASTGIGAALNKDLLKAGHQTLTVDIKEADIQADLSTAEGRKQMAAEINAQAADGLDGLIPCAGVGPNLPASAVTSINYFGVRATWDCAYPLLQKKRGTVVIISSNSAPMRFKNSELVAAMLENDEEKALQLAESLDGTTIYAGGKKALAYWMRKNCKEWARNGVRVNAIAPGMTMTPLVQSNFDDPRFVKQMEDFKATIPAQRTATAEEMAVAIQFLLGPDSAYCYGTVLFVDGGVDAMTNIECF